MWKAAVGNIGGDPIEGPKAVMHEPKYPQKTVGMIYQWVRSWRGKSVQWQVSTLIVRLFDIGLFGRRTGFQSLWPWKINRVIVILC